MPGTPLKIALVAMNRPGYQSLGLAYIRAYAENHERLRGHVAFQTLELTSEMSAVSVAYRVLRTGPDMVAFSVQCWNAAAVFEACGILRQARPDLTIVLGGPEVGPIAEEVLAAHPCVDIVVRGEGEETFAELLRVSITGKTPSKCPGVTARAGEEIISAPDRPPIEDLDSLPSPYLAGTVVASPGFSYIETYRGCPHNCSYCFEAKGIKGIRTHSRERVAAEIAAVAATPGVRAFSFVDSVFNLTAERLGWLADLLEPYARQGLRLHTVEVDIERIDEAQARDLKRAGVASVETGPQTIGARALANSHRSFDPERFARGVEVLKQAGISVECDLIIGLPGDDPFCVVGGLRWLLELDPGIVQSSTLHVLPGTDLCARSGELGLAYTSEPAHCVMQTPEMSFQDIRRLEIMAGALQSSYRARLD